MPKNSAFVDVLDGIGNFVLVSVLVNGLPAIREVHIIIEDRISADRQFRVQVIEHIPR